MILALIAFVLGLVQLAAQTPASTGTQFEVVSIKRNTSGSDSGGMRNTPDGSLTMTNQPIRSILSSASPEPVREVEGFPDWAITERYDIVAKAPAGSTRANYREMVRNLLIDRMKVAGHVEQRERNAFGMVLARRDGRLGPGLTPPRPECITPATPGNPRPVEVQRACGSRMPSD